MEKQKKIHTKKLLEALDDFDEWFNRQKLWVDPHQLAFLKKHMKNAWEESLHNAIQQRKFTC